MYPLFPNFQRSTKSPLVLVRCYAMPWFWIGWSFVSYLSIILFMSSFIQPHHAGCVVLVAWCWLHCICCMMLAALCLSHDAGCIVFVAWCWPLLFQPLISIFDERGRWGTRVSHNVLRVGDVALCCACGKAILLTRCYEQGFIVVCAFRFLKYSRISSLVILDNFSLNLSLCWRINFTASNVFSVVFIFFKFPWWAYF